MKKYLFYLVYVAAALADLIHDVPDVVAESLVLPPNLVQRGEALRVSVPHAEQLRSRSPAIALRMLQLLAEAVGLQLPVRHRLVELLEPLLHLVVDDPGLGRRMINSSLKLRYTIML